MSAPAQPWLVWSHEHNAFWRPDRCGYTKFIEQAGRYTRAEAEAICKNANYGKARARSHPIDEDDLPNEICFPAPEAADNFAKSAAHGPRLIAALQELLPFAECIQDEGPVGSGWKSKELVAAIAEAEAAIREYGS